MSATIDKQWLQDNGIEANHPDVESLVEVVNTEWEMRVGYSIAELLSEAQIDEFEAIEAEDAQIEWLENVYPEYPDTVAEISEALADELKNAEDKPGLISVWQKQQAVS